MSRQGIRFLLFLLGVGIFAASVFAAIQYSTPYIPEYDGYYHIKFAQLIREGGFLTAFPWLPLTTFGERFSDMHLLFHYLLVPFTFIGLMGGAKLYAVVSGTLVVLAFAWILHKENIPGGIFWVVGLFSSSLFLYRFTLPKASQLSIFFLLAGLYLIWTRRSTCLLVLSFLYTWLYVAFPILLLFAFFQFLSSVFLKEKADLRSLVFITLGMAAGLVVNPYFPDNVWYYYTQTFQISTLQRIPMGGEWYPWETWYFFKENAVVFSCLFLAVFFSLLQGGKKDAKTIALFLITTFFLFLSFKSRRFVEYFVPFGLLFAGFSIKETVQTTLKSDPNRRWLRPLFFFLLILVGITSYKAVMRTSKEVRVNAWGTLNPLYEGCAAWLEQNTPKDSLVFHSDWDDFPALFFFNTHNRYVVGIDPNFLYLKNPGLWQYYAGITQGTLRNPASLIQQVFGARYVFTDKLHKGFMRNLYDEGHADLEYEDDACAVYVLTGQASEDL